MKSAVSVVRELPIDGLTPIHGIHPETGEARIASTTASLAGRGFLRGFAVDVVELDDGRRLLEHGRHRLAAMARLGEPTIPCRVTPARALDPSHVATLVEMSRLTGNFHGGTPLEVSEASVDWDVIRSHAREMLEAAGHLPAASSIDRGTSSTWGASAPSLPPGER